MSRSCLANRECDSGFCKDAQCVEPTKMGDPCKAGRCRGLTCDFFSERCVTKDFKSMGPHDCRTSADCQATHYCNKRQKCQYLRMMGDECSGDEACNDGYSCFSGVCRRRCLMDGHCSYDKCYSFKRHPYNLCFKENYEFSPEDLVAGRVGSTPNWLLPGVAAIGFIMIAVVFVLLRRRAKRMEAVNVIQLPQPYAVYSVPGPTGPFYQDSLASPSIPQPFAPGEAPPSYNEVSPGRDHNEKN